MDLHFGVEIEVLLGSRKMFHRTWKSMAKDLSKRLQKAGISNHVNDTNNKSADNYREWSIVQEVTIPSQPAANLWGLELVSPVYAAQDYWAADLDAIFNILHSSFTIVPSKHCSTHIHVSHAPSPFSAFDLAAIATAILYYEPAVDALVPEHRRANNLYWCQSNRASISLTRAVSFTDCAAMIDWASNENGTKGVVEAMNMFSASSAYGRAHGRTKDFVRGKVYKWDFSRMLDLSKGTGTVEFRQPPGSINADEATAWVTLALAFVAGAVADAENLFGNANGATMEDLWELLFNGATRLGWDGLGSVGALFGTNV